MQIIKLVESNRDCSWNVLLGSPLFGVKLSYYCSIILENRLYPYYNVKLGWESLNNPEYYVLMVISIFIHIDIKRIQGKWKLICKFYIL